MRISRIYRILRLVTMLQSGRNWTVAQLAEELEVSRRTIFRDLNMLEMAHIPYYYDRDGGTYRINSHFFLPPVNLTLSEALALLVCSRRTKATTAAPLATAGRRAAMKIESVLSEPVREYLGLVMERMAIVPTPSARHEGLDSVFNRLVGAVADRKVCRLTYASLYEGKQIALSVEPWRLVFVGRAWYLIAYSHMHRERRTFKLSRFKKLSVTEEAFAVPDKHIEDHGFGDAWCMIPEGKTYDVHLRFKPKVAANVAEVDWHRSQRIKWGDDGSIDFFVHVDGLGEIMWWILGYGDQAKVIAPRMLARRVAAAAGRVAAQYGGKSY